MKTYREKRAGASAGEVRTVAKGGLTQFLGLGTDRVARLVFVGVAVRLLGPVGYGIYRQVVQVLNMASVLATAGFDTAALRSIAQARVTEAPGAVRGTTRLAMGSVSLVSAVIFIILFIAAVPIAAALAEGPSQQREITFLLRLGAGFVPLFALMQVLRACTQGFKTVVPSVIVGNVVQPVSLLLLATLALAMGYGVVGVVGALVASALLGLLAGLWFYRRLLSPEERNVPPRASLRSMTAFALPRAGDRIFSFGGIGVLMLGLLASDREVTLFAIAGSLQMIAGIFPQAILSIWQPLVADLEQRGEMERLESLYQTITRWTASGAFFIVVGLIILPEPFVRLLGGQEVADAAILTTILAIGTLFNVGTGPSAAVVMMAGYPVVNFLNSAVMTMTYIGLAWLVIPAHGAVGLAVVQAGTKVALNMALVVEGRLLTGTQPFGRSYLKPITASMIAGSMLLLWRFLVPRDVILDLGVLVLVGGIYVATLFLMGADAEDRIIYQSIKRRIKSLAGQ